MSEESPAAAPAEETAGAQPNLGIYKNPELIESVVVFDPVNTSNSQRFIDTMKIGALGLTHPAVISDDRTSYAANYAGYAGSNVLPYAVGAANMVSDPKILEVCSEVVNSGGTATRNLSGAATVPIQFRFDGIPLVLPRESYFEVTLNLMYVGPSFITGTSSQKFKNMLEGVIKSQGWARTASGLIQLVQSVDISATSFQSPDMTTQTFLEAVQTKDAEIELRPDFYFNSYASFKKLTFEQKMESTTVVDYANTVGEPTAYLMPSMSTVPVEQTSTFSKISPFTIPVTFRIPLSAISPVFKTNVLPLFMTNSTSITIQCQLQNPNIPFPLHSVMGDNIDGTPYFKSTGFNCGNIGSVPVGTSSNLADYQRQNGIDRFLVALSPGDFTEKDVAVAANHIPTWGFTPMFQTVGTLSAMADGGLHMLPPALYVGDGSAFAGENATAKLFTDTMGSEYGVYAGTQTSIAQAGSIDDLGQLQYCFWAPEFTIRAYLKTYASALNNPLVARYLRPYLVGPEGQPAFFRSAYLSYNFNAQTWVVPAGSSIPFNFNISQTLINVPMAFLMFSEISGEKQFLPTQIVPVLSWPDTAKNTCFIYTTQKGSPATPLEPGPTIITGAGSAVTMSESAPNTFTFGITGDSTDVGTYEYRSEKYGLLDVFHRNHYIISPELDIHGVQVSIGPSGWNLYQRPLDIKAMNEITLNTLTRYDPEMVWKQRVSSPTRFYIGDAWACFDLSHDEYRGLFIDSDNMLNVTGMFTNSADSSKTIYVQLILPYIDHFIINVQDATVTKSQL